MSDTDTTIHKLSDKFKKKFILVTKIELWMVKKDFFTKIETNVNGKRCNKVLPSSANRCDVTNSHKYHKHYGGQTVISFFVLLDLLDDFIWWLTVKWQWLFLSKRTPSDVKLTLNWPTFSDFAVKVALVCDETLLQKN